jgi:hypothetical protein
MSERRREGRIWRQAANTRDMAYATRLILLAALAFGLATATVANGSLPKEPGGSIPAPPYATYRHEAHAQLAGTGADCYAYAWRAYDLMRADGLESRVVVVFASSSPYDTHSFDEVRSSDGRWVIQDPTFDGWWSIDGHAASAEDLQDALAANRLGDVIWHGPAADITKYYVNPLLLFRTVWYQTLGPSGVAVATGTRTVPLPDLYYAATDVPGATAQVMVITGGSNWHVGPYTFMQESGGKWVSPIGFLTGLPVTGDGDGQLTTLEVGRLPAAQVAP